MKQAVIDNVLAAAKTLSQEEITKSIDECLGGRQFGSYIDPDREAQTWANGFYESDKEVFILIGTGRFHYHRALIRKMHAAQKLIILDWKLPLIALALAEGVLPNDSRVQLEVFENLNQVLVVLAELFEKYITKKIKFDILPPYELFFQKDMAKIRTDLKNFLSLNTVISRTIDLFGLDWAINYYRNLPHILEKGIPFKDFYSAFKGVPAIVVSAGPSLEKNIHLLRGLQDKALIIASGSAIETLYKVYNIRPHFLVSFDPGEGNYPHFQKLDTKSLRLIFTGEIYPPILNEFKGALIPVEAANKRSYDLYKYYGAPALGESLIGPTVSNLALDVAVKMGCHPIALIGQDLALRDGLSHATGNFYRSEVKDLSGYIKVKGNVEEFVYTDRPWLAMLKAFEQQVKDYSGTTIINATEGGAFIEGTVVKTLQSVIDEHISTSYNIEEKIEFILGHSVNRAVKAKDILSRVLSDADDIICMLDRALNTVNCLLTLLRKNKTDKKVKQLIKEVKALEEQLMDSIIYKVIIRPIIYGRILYFERHYSCLSSEQPENVEIWVAEYQNIIFESAKSALRAYYERLSLSKSEC